MEQAFRPASKAEFLNWASAPEGTVERTTKPQPQSGGRMQPRAQALGKQKKAGTKSRRDGRKTASTEEADPPALFDALMVGGQ